MNGVIPLHHRQPTRQIANGTQKTKKYISPNYALKRVEKRKAIQEAHRRIVKEHTSDREKERSVLEESKWNIIKRDFQKNPGKKKI